MLNGTPSRNLHKEQWALPGKGLSENPIPGVLSEDTLRAIARRVYEATRKRPYDGRTRFHAA
jgi:hypothetical protein